MYNFETLSPKDFELLTRDLLQKELSITLETFKSGKDGGIDLRHSKDTLNQLIVQCKHYKNSTLKDLYNTLKIEIEKIKILNPKRYIISTSQSLTPKNKDKIMQICSPFIKSTSDIYGSDDLNNLIAKFPEIEKDHFKLWLTSTTILEQILHSNIVNESRFKLDEIKEKIKKFVSNPSVNEAQNILNSENFVVISGAPGVGKTTLAEMIVYSYVADGGYEFFNISENIQDAYSVYNLDPNVKQIFYYDDFLGETHLTKNEDSSLITFINRINKSKNKKLILTTREYILQQSKLLHEKIDNFDFKKCIIDLKQYTNQIKAEILYSHLYFSDLPANYSNSIIKNDNYFKIIKHPNYNPRIIEYMTKQKLHEKVIAEFYFNTFINNLDNPSQIWNHAFENQLNNKTRSVLFAMVTYAKNYLAYDKNDIKNSAQLVCRHLYSEELTGLDYKKALKILIGDFIHADINYFEFANPSVRDFLENYILNNNLLLVFIDICQNIHQYRWLYNTFITYKKINKKYAKCLFNKLKTANSSKHNLEITELMINLIIDIGDKSLITDIQEKLNCIKEYTCYLYNYQEVFSKLRYSVFEDSDIVKCFINDVAQNIIENLDYIDDLDDYVNIANFIDDHKFSFNEQDVEKIADYISDKFEDLKEEAIDEYGGYSDELIEARDKLEEINDKLGLSEDLDDIEDIISQLEEQEEVAVEYNKEEDVRTYSNNSSNKAGLNILIQEEKYIRSLFDTLEKQIKL